MRGCSPVTTPWFHGWNIIAVGILIQAITIGLMTYSFTFWVASFESEFGAGIGTILLAASLSHVATAALSPVCGKILDANAVRPLIISGIVIFCIGYFLLALCQSMWQVILLYSTVLPIGASLAGPLPAQVATVRWFERKRGLALGITALGSSIGGFVFPPVVTLLIGWMGWRTSHVALGAGILMLMVPVIWVFMREPGASDIERGNTSHDDPSSSAVVTLPEWTTSQLLMSRTFWAMTFAFMPMLSIYLGYKFNLAPIASDSGISLQQASIVMSVHSGMALCAKLAFGYMADRLEHRILMWCAAAFILGSLLLPQFSSSYLFLLLSFGMLGLAGGSFLPLMGAIGASRFGSGCIGRVIGLMGPLMMIGSFGPSALAYMRSSIGSYGPVLQIAMALLVPAVVAVFFLGPAVSNRPTVKSRA